jgi:hypothetical protein
MEADSRSRIGIDDFYWLAVPLWEIQKEAKSHGFDCISSPAAEFNNCARDMVRTIVCPCMSGCDAVIETASQFFCDNICSP